jgi:hypothetical protein
LNTIDQQIEDNITLLIKIDKENEKKKQETILELARNLQVAIKQQSPRTMNRLKMLNLPTDNTAIARFIIWIIKNNKLSIGKSWVYENIPKTCKEEYDSKGRSPEVLLSNNYIKEHAEELLYKIKELVRTPAKDIKIKIRKDVIDQQGWKTRIAYALVQLAKKVEEDETVDEELDKEISEKINMVKDGRFATTWARYEAIVVATNTTKSLTKAIEEEWTPLKRQEIMKNEKGCRECYCSGEPHAKCNCHCHRTTQEMTTKGLKWAVKHNKRLGEFDESMKRIADMDREDICPAMKALFTNPNMDKHMSHDDKMNILTRHIEKEQCIRCETFLDLHPTFFEAKQ